MDWETALNVAFTAAGLAVGVVVLWAYGHLRLIFQRQTEKQLQHVRRLMDTIEKQQSQIEQLHAAVKALSEQSGKLTRVVSGMVERNGGGDGDAADDSRRLLH